MKSAGQTAALPRQYSYTATADPTVEDSVDSQVCVCTDGGRQAAHNALWHACRGCLVCTCCGILLHLSNRRRRASAALGVRFTLLFTLFALERRRCTYQTEVQLSWRAHVASAEQVGLPANKSLSK